MTHEPCIPGLLWKACLPAREPLTSHCCTYIAWGKSHVNLISFFFLLFFKNFIHAYFDQIQPHESCQFREILRRFIYFLGPNDPLLALGRKVSIREKFQKEISGQILILLEILGTRAGTVLWRAWFLTVSAEWVRAVASLPLLSWDQVSRKEARRRPDLTRGCRKAQLSENLP